MRGCIGTDGANRHASRLRRVEASSRRSLAKAARRFLSVVHQPCTVVALGFYLDSCHSAFQDGEPQPDPLILVQFRECPALFAEAALFFDYKLRMDYERIGHLAKMPRD